MKTAYTFPEGIPAALEGIISKLRRELPSLQRPPPFVPIHSSPEPSLSKEYTTSLAREPGEAEAR